MGRKKYNFNKIIFIIVDTLRQENLVELSNGHSQIPNIDYLQKNGLSFSNAYTSITKTDPSITAIMTGNYPLRNGLVNHGSAIGIEEEESIKKLKFLPDFLKERGYKNIAVDWISRWHKKGFDYYSGPMDIDAFISKNLQPEYLARLYSLGKITVKLFKRELFQRFYFCFSTNPRIPYDSADKVINKGIEQLKKNKKNKLFLYLHLWDTHEPHTQPQGLKSYIFDTVDETYNAEIKFIDKQIGILVNYLRESVQLDETLIIFTSDHGENFYESGSPFGHDTLYENVAKIPLILSSPAFPKKRIDSLVQNIDIMPTLLDLLNIKVDKHLDGKSLLPIIEGQKKEVRSVVFFEDIINKKRLMHLGYKRRRGIRIGNYKFIQTLGGDREEISQIMPRGNLKIVNTELYNLKKDPKEKNNLFQKNIKFAKSLSFQLENLISELNLKRSNSRPVSRKKG